MDGCTVGCTERDDFEGRRVGSPARGVGSIYRVSVVEGLIQGVIKDIIGTIHTRRVI